jgi:flagellin FlaB
MDASADRCPRLISKEEGLIAYVRNLMRKAHRNEEGITGLETAIILIAFVVVATVFAFVVLTTGIFSAERGKETVFAGLQKARGTMEVRGGIVVNASTIAAGPPQEMTAGTIQFTVANTAGGDAIPLDPDATTNKTVIAYRDDAVIAQDITYLATFYGGDGDLLLEPGEQAVILIDIADITLAITNGGTLELNPNDRWTLELQTPVGAVIDLTRSFPAQIDAIMQLH